MKIVDQIADLATWPFGVAVTLFFQAVIAESEDEIRLFNKSRRAAAPLGGFHDDGRIMVVHESVMLDKPPFDEGIYTFPQNFSTEEKRF